MDMTNTVPDSNKVPDTPEAREFRKNHWTIDAGINSGQVKPGQVDEAQVEFLKKTEFIIDKKENT